MDRKAIIDGLKMTRDLCVFDPSTGEEIEPHLLNDINRATYDACKGALEILEQLDTDSDTISRKAVIDALCQMPVFVDCDNNAFIDKVCAIIRITHLPPAQPEIIRCKDCARYDGKGHCERDVRDILGYGREWNEDDYCSDGIRKGE